MHALLKIKKLYYIRKCFLKEENDNSKCQEITLSIWLFITRNYDVIKILTFDIVMFQIENVRFRELSKEQVFGVMKEPLMRM